jgi:hypothetical protein
MRRLLTLAATGAILAGCAETPPPSPSAADAPGVVETLEVRCDGETTEVLTPTVQARSDGVHIRVMNTAAADVLIQWELGGDGASPGESLWSFPILPGPARFRCLPSTDDVDPGAPGGWASFEVLAFEGWVSPELECPGTMYGGVVDYVEGARGVEDPLSDAEEQFRLEGTAKEAGYRSVDERTVVNLTADGPKESLVYISDGAGGWLRSESAGCSD